MPETSMTWWGNRPIPGSACLMAARIPKSPQPGHQVDLSPPLKSFRSGLGGVSVSGMEGYPYARLDPFDDPAGRERATVVFGEQDVGLTAGIHAQHVGQL